MCAELSLTVEPTQFAFPGEQPEIYSATKLRFFLYQKEYTKDYFHASISSRNTE